MWQYKSILSYEVFCDYSLTFKEQSYTRNGKKTYLLQITQPIITLWGIIMDNRRLECQIFLLSRLKSK